MKPPKTTTRLCAAFALLVGCGVVAGCSGGSVTCDEEWDQADELNSKLAPGPEGECHLCAETCQSLDAGFWGVVSEDTGKRDLDEDVACDVEWVGVEPENRRVTRDSVCV
jgi:hypothetical protein